MKVTEVLNVWLATDRSKKVVVIMILVPKRGKTRKTKGKVNFRFRIGTFWEKVQISLQCCHIRRECNSVKIFFWSFLFIVTGFKLSPNRKNRLVVQREKSAKIFKRMGHSKVLLILFHLSGHTS